MTSFFLKKKTQMIILTAYNARAAAQDHITAPRPQSGLGFVCTTPNQDQNQLPVKVRSGFRAFGIKNFLAALRRVARKIH
jgi:hypothetical protein